MDLAQTHITIDRERSRERIGRDVEHLTGADYTRSDTAICRYACSEQLARIAELVARGDVRVEIAEVVPLTEVQRAHELSESGHTRGKIILTVGT